MPNHIMTQNSSDSTMLPIDIYLGGSFNPVHCGHIAMLQHVYDAIIDLEGNTDNPDNHAVNAYFLPTSRSPLKLSSIDPKHKMAMLACAIDELNMPDCKTADYHICEEEVWQPPPTYTIDTLTTLREKSPETSLVFIVGADNIANLEKWRDGLLLTTLAHLWVLPRDDWQSPTDLYELLPKSLQSQVTHCVDDLKSNTHGHIYIDSKNIAPIASSDIRAAIANNQDNQIKYALPSSVYCYIIKHNLYRKP